MASSPALAEAGSRRSSHKRRHKYSHSSARVSPYKSAVVLDDDTGSVLYAKNAHKPWPPASMTKMMVMLIALEDLKKGDISLKDKVRISRKASRTGGRRIDLHYHQVVSLQDLLKAMIITSANDAAVAVAEYIAKSTHNFVRLMNLRARQLNMRNTVFRTVNGLPLDGDRIYDVSTAYDMALLGRRLADFGQVLKWTSEPMARIHLGRHTRVIINVNPMVSIYPGADGLKTGFTYRSGFNLTATAKRKDVRIIAVVMGSPNKADRRRAAVHLLNLGFHRAQMADNEDNSSG